MEFIGEIFTISTVLIVCILAFRFHSGLLLDFSEVSRVVAAVCALVSGSIIGLGIFNSIDLAGGKTGFSCTEMTQIKFFYNCGGWPVVGAEAKDFVDKLFKVSINLTMLTPGFAAVIGAIYIHRSLLTNWSFDWLDAGKICFGGFMLMSSIVLLPKIAVGFSSLLLSAGNFGDLVKEGQNNLASLIQLIDTASYEINRQEDPSWLEMIELYFLRFGVFSLSGIVNFVGPVFIMIQLSIFISAPVAFLGAVLTDGESKEKALEIALSYAKFTLVQLIFWAMFTLAPKVENPTDFESLGVIISGQAFLLSLLVITLSIGLMFVSIKFITIPILMHTVKRLT